VKSLSRAPVEVTVIDRQNHHCFQPLLYQVATAALSPADVAWPIRHILRKQKNATVLMAEVRAVDTSKRLVQIDSMTIPYDYLVLATGATHSYFGHDEWAEVAPGLKRIAASVCASRAGAAGYRPCCRWLCEDRQGIASRDRMNDFFLFPWRGRLDGSMKLWFLRRRCVLCRLRRL
jgi:hypothetical protein